MKQENTPAFNMFFIFDKFIELMLIFIGLVGALWFDNYIQEIEKKNRYIESLISIHTEILTNIDLSKKYDVSLDEWMVITTDMIDLVRLGAKETYSGILKIRDTENEPFETKTYKSYDNDTFLNKALYAEIVHLYDLYHISEKFAEIPRTATTNMYKAYYSLYASTVGVGEWNGNDVVDLNYNLRVAQLYIASAQIRLRDVNVTSNRVLEYIENEIATYNTTIEKSRTYSDMYWLSWSSITTDPKKSLEFARLGIQLIESLNERQARLRKGEIDSYYGRLNRNAFHASKSLIEAGDSTINDSDMLVYLENWERSGIYLEQCYIQYIDYYFKKRNFDKFLRYTEIAIENTHPYEIFRLYLSGWKEYMITDDVQALMQNSIVPIEWWNGWISPRRLEP